MQELCWRLFERSSMTITIINMAQVRKEYAQILATEERLKLRQEKRDNMDLESDSRVALRERRRACLAANALGRLGADPGRSLGSLS